MSFKTFLAERASPTHALKYLEYEHYHHDKCVDSVKNKLLILWNRELEKHDIEEPLVDKNDKLSYDIIIDKNEAKIGRYDTRHLVSPSILVGGGVNSDIRNKCKKNIMKGSLDIISKIADKLNVNLKGSPFYASQDDGPLGDIRMKFKTGNFKKTILLIGLEPGRKFERIYLRDFIA